MMTHAPVPQPASAWCACVEPISAFRHPAPLPLYGVCPPVLLLLPGIRGRTFPERDCRPRKSTIGARLSDRSEICCICSYNSCCTMWFFIWVFGNEMSYKNRVELCFLILVSELKCFRIKILSNTDFKLGALVLKNSSIWMAKSDFDQKQRLTSNTIIITKTM